MMPEFYGRLDTGEQVERHSLEIDGMRVAVLTYGAIVERLECPDRDGRMENVVLGLRSLAAYTAGNAYFGAVAGRFANRIAGGRFSLDGADYRLACNDGPNSLHGGVRGFDRRVWRVAEAGPRHVVLVLTSPDGEEGFPGELTTTVTYMLQADRALRIDYAAETSHPTVLNLTNHSYFNLAGEGSGSVLDHVLQIDAGHFLPVDGTAIPTGEIRPVAGTPFDFRQPTALGARIREDHPQILLGRGYDHNWIIDKPTLQQRVARLHDPASGRTLHLLTDQPGLQVYTANFLDGRLVGPSGRAYRQGDAVTLETQHFPDSPNQPSFPTTTLRPGEVFRSSTTFRLSVE